MMLLQLLQLAARNVILRWRSNALVWGALAITTAIVATGAGVVRAVRDDVETTATALMGNHLNVYGIRKLNHWRAATVMGDARPVIAAIKTALPDARRITRRLLGNGTVSSPLETTQPMALLGVQAEEEPELMAWLKPVAGELKALAGDDAILLFADQAKRLGVGVGDVVTVSVMTDRGVNNALDLEVVAVAADSGIGSRTNVVMSFEALRSLLQYQPHAAGVIEVQLPGDPDPAALVAAQEKVRAVLASEGHRFLDHVHEGWGSMVRYAENQPWVGQRLEVLRLDEEEFMIEVGGSIGALDFLLFLLAVILLTVVAVGLMNTVWLAISERTREIGTMRALGMGRRSVVLLFAVETLLLGVAGTATGALLAPILAAAINGAGIPVPQAAQFLFGAGEALRCAIDPALLLRVAIVLTGSTTLLSFIPSRQAAKISPAVAMQLA